MTRRDASSTLRGDPLREETYRFFDPSQPIAHCSGNLPHWRQENVTYFVTFRLADSIPKEKLRCWLKEREGWLQRHPEPHNAEERAEFWKLFPAQFHRWLDAGFGRCVCAQLGVAEIVSGALQHFDGDRYLLGEYVVMPNHVHVLVAPLGERQLSDILRSVKSYSAKRINAVLKRSGPIWQQESFDHIVRSPAQLERIVQYIRDNPKGKRSVTM